LNFVTVIRNSTIAVFISANVCRRKRIGLEILELKLKLIVNENLARKERLIIEADEK
jgi:hypothetical protein